MLNRIANTLSFWQQTPNIIEDSMQNQLLSLGIYTDIESGHLYYTSDFKPPEMNCEIIFFRHGETYGNCGQCLATGEIDREMVKGGIKDREKRIFQGNVDTIINQLTEFGELQAEELAIKLNIFLRERQWEPDLVLLSPLTRAQNTALPFIIQNELYDKCIIYDDVKEMSFGSWENRRVCDFAEDDPSHSFYREQNALIKKVGPDVFGIPQNAENFCEVLLRAHRVLMDLNQKYPGKKILISSHSMFGAAMCILLGKGKKIENGEYLAFDGKRQDGSTYTMPHAEPFLLTSGNIAYEKKLINNR